MVQFAATAHYPFFRKGDIMKKRVLTISLAGILIACLLTFAGCKRHGHHKGAEFMVDYASEVLDLTDAQQADLNQIKDEFMEKTEQMHADKDAMKATLMAQLASEQMDEVELKRIHGPVSNHRYRQYRRCRDSHHPGWAGRPVLDVGHGLLRHGDQVHRMHPVTEVS